jgi:hypothetical protein
MGKLAHALAAVARLRLDNEDTASVIWSKIQVAFNNVARSITGVRRGNRVNIPDLLNLAGIASANRMVVKAVAVEAWLCSHSHDGKDGPGTTLSASCLRTTRLTRPRRPD